VEKTRIEVVVTLPTAHGREKGKGTGPFLPRRPGEDKRESAMRLIDMISAQKGKREISFDHRRKRKSK